MASKKALFLDRDGVINVDHGYVHKIEDFHFMEGIFELCRAACSKGYMIIVITNQAGIGRGYYSEDSFLNLTNWMKGQFADEGAHIDAVYFSPYHPEHGTGKYKLDSFCRKPNPGMLIQAASDHDINLEVSLLVGDKESDVEAGLRAGLGKLFFFRPSYGLHYSNSCMEDRVIEVTSLSDVKAYL